MAETIETILEQAELRPNPHGGNGYLLRSDIQSIREIEAEGWTEDRFKEIIDSVPFLPLAEKVKIKGDFESYP